jgi:hypothetical protein
VAVRWKSRPGAWALIPGVGAVFDSAMGVDLRFCARDRGPAMEEVDFFKVCIGGFWCVKVYRRGRWVFTFVHPVHFVTWGGGGG